MTEECAWKGCEEKEAPMRDLRFIAPNGEEIRAIPIPLCDYHLKLTKQNYQSFRSKWVEQ